MLKMTGEYIGGLLAGTGVGIELYGYFNVVDPFLNVEWFIAGFLLIAIGALTARRAQRQNSDS